MKHEYDLINLFKIKAAIESVFDKLGIDVNVDYDPGAQLGVDCNLKSKLYKDDIRLGIRVYPSGLATYNFYFDELDKTEKALDLLNQFNDNVLCLKATLSNIGYLLISCEVEILTEDVAAAYTKKVLKDLVDDTTAKYLIPLSKLTHQ